MDANKFCNAIERIFKANEINKWICCKHIKKSHLFNNLFLCQKKTDDSDAENDTENKNEDDKSETNGDSAADSADNGDATAGGDDEG